MDFPVPQAYRRRTIAPVDLPFVPYSAPVSAGASTLPSGATSPLAFSDEEGGTLEFVQYEMGEGSMSMSAGLNAKPKRIRRRCQSPTTLALRKERR